MGKVRPYIEKSVLSSTPVPRSQSWGKVVVIEEKEKNSACQRACHETKCAVFVGSMQT